MLRFLMKVLKIILSIIACLFLMVTIFVIYDMCQPSKPITNTSPPQIDVKKDREIDLFNTESYDTSVSLTSNAYNTFLKQLESMDTSFEYADKYSIEEALDLYKKMDIQKDPEVTILDEHGRLDANLLYHQVLKNNQTYMSGGVDAINTFFTEISSSDLSTICTLIEEVVNSEYKGEKTIDVARRLMNLTVFERKGSASNAYVNDQLTLTINPTMIKMFSSMQQVSGSDQTENDTKKSVIIHEIMHLLEFSSGDHHPENGLEAGFCRKYSDLVDVDSLWYTWLLEAGAELGMSDYLDIEPTTYQKKISYVNSINLANFHYYQEGIESYVFVDTLEEVFKKLNLKTASSQLEFLQLLYSIELTQTIPDDFFETTDENEITQIRMSIREDAVKYMTSVFYRNLVQAIKEQKVKDLKSVFYLMRIWELDCFKHLEYDNETSLEYAREVISLQDQLQKNLFEAIAYSTDLDLMDSYNNYCLNLKVEDTIVNHCDFSQYSKHTQDFLHSLKKNYTSSKFIRISEIINE